MKYCINHPSKKAISTCHGCGRDFCEQCLDAGSEYYYCKNPECQKLLKKELRIQQLPNKMACPACGSEIKISKDQKNTGKVHCTKCDVMIDFNFDPPKILNKIEYVEILSTLNQGDIALIKSILEDGKIDYYTTGENFLSVSPLLEPAKFFVNQNQLNETKELLKDFELHIFGASTNR